MSNDARQGCSPRGEFAPTNLLTHEPNAGSTNCLGLAAQAARDGRDEIVFLSAPHHQVAEPGHVILRDRDTAAVREPDTTPDLASAVSVEAYAAAAGRRILAIVPAGLVRGLLLLSPVQRLAALVGLSGPLSDVAHLSFAGGILGVKADDPRITPETRAAVTLAKDWNKYDVGKMSGTDYSDPSANLPQDLQDALKFVNNDTTLYNAMIKGNGGKDGDPLTKADVEKFAHDSVVDSFTSDAPSAPWNEAASSSDTEKLGLSDSQKAELNKPIEVAQSLVDNWHGWGLSSGVTGFDKVPDDIPQQGKDALNYLQSNPALLKAIGSGKDDGGPITRDDVAKFVSKATGDAKAGVQSLNDFLKANPDAPDATKRLAQSAAIVRGNETLFSAGDPNPKTPVDGNLTTTDLENIGGQGPEQYGMGDTLTQAANLWSQAGLFNQLDVGGQDAATSKADGVANGDNITNWISKQAPALTGPALGAFLTDATNRGMVAGTDTSKLGPDFFDHLGDNHDGAQKAAVLQQLTDTESKFSAGVDASDWDAYDMPGVNSDPNQVKGDIANKIAQLTADPDVQKFKSDHFGGDLQNLVSMDPSLHGGVQSYYNGDLQSGKALTDALGTKDGNGQKVSAEQGLQSFVQTANTLSLALGTSDTLGGDSKPLPGLDLQAIAQKSGQQGALQDAYTNDILSGNELKQALDGGTDTGTAVQQFEADAADFGTTLPTQYVADSAQKLQQTFSDTLSDGLERNATTGDVNTAFEDKDGNLDTAKLNDAISQAIAADPAFATDSKGDKVKPDQIVSAVNSIFADVRNGTKLQDAIAKLAKAQNAEDPAFKSPSGIATDAYNKGLMHAVGAVFNAGVMAAKTAEGAGKGSPTVTASALGSGFQAIGGALEAGTKYAKSANITPFTPDDLKGIEGAGKAMGGAGGIVGGAVGIFSGVQSLKDGDKAGGGVGLADGITGAWSGVSSLVEGGVGVADAVLGSIGVDTAALAATSATLGIVGGVTALLGTVGLGIYGMVEGAKRVDDFMGQITPELNQYGITGGSVASNDPPQDSLPPGES